MLRFRRFLTIHGEMQLCAQEDALTRLYLPGEPFENCANSEDPLLLRAEAELLEYLRGSRRAFSVPLAPRGTAFQSAVWTAVSAIPYGQTRCYAEIARQTGCPRAARAVGSANRQNPLPILIPCHRVIGKNASLTGYKGGMALKRALLALENPRRWSLPACTI